MKHHHTLLQACLAVGSIGLAGPGFAAVLASDDFDGQTIGTGLKNTTTTGAPGWGTDWRKQGGSTSDYVYADADPLTYTGVTSSAAYANHTGGSENAGRQFDLGGTFSAFQSSPGGKIDTGTLYLSVLLRINDFGEAANADTYFAIHDNQGNSSFRDEGSGSTQYVRFGSFGGGNWSLELEGSPLINSSVAAVEGRTDLLVLKIDQSTDTFSLFVNPTTNTEPVTADASGVFTGFEGFRGVAWEGGLSSLDRIRVGETFADVAPGDIAPVIPEPASLLLTGAGMLCLMGRRRRA